MFNKKPWSDAPFPDFEHLNAFESKFYCFGGDGGGNSGGGSNSNSNSEQNQRADAQEPIRGGRRAAAVPAPSLTPAQQATMDQVSTAAQQSLDAKNPAVQDFRDRLAAGQFNAAPQSRVTASPTRVPAGQPVSFVEADKVGIGSMMDTRGISFDYDKPTTASKTYEADTFLGNTINRDGYKMGPGRLEPTIDPQNKSVGLNYKIDIAQQDPQTYAQNQALANQNMAQLEYPTIEDRGSLSGRSFEIPVRQRSLYEGLAKPMYGITLEDIAGPNPIVDLSDLKDSASRGNPYAGTTGAFVPQRIQVDAQGRVTEVPVGFGAGGIVSLLEPLGDYLGNQIDQQRVDPFLEMVENAAYQEFGIDPSSGGGGMGSVGFDDMAAELPGETFGPGQMKPQVGFEALAYDRMEAEGGGEDLTRPMRRRTDIRLGRQIMKPQVQPDILQSALGYFGETYNTFNADTGMSSTAMTPELMVQQAQSRLMQRDMKPKAVTDYLNNIIQTGGKPTMMAPDMSGNMQQLNLLEVGPGGGVSSGQALSSTNPYQAQLQSAFGGIGSLF